MSRHSKETSIKPKTLIYIVAVVAVVLIIILAIVSIVKNTGNNKGSGNSATSNTSQSNSNTQSGQDNTGNSGPQSPNPQISGVENGKIYYTTQHIIVSDDNLKSVTVNGDDFNENFFIEGNAENMYVIEATDQDNNVTTYIVYTKTIKSLADEINTLNKYNVTLDNLESLQYVKEAIQNTGTKYSPPEESSELDNILTICENLLNKIGEVKQKFDTITTDYENPEHLESVQNNIQKLAAMITDIDELLASNNLTDTQRTQLTSIRAKYSSWLAAASANEQLF